MFWWEDRVVLDHLRNVLASSWTMDEISGYRYHHPNVVGAEDLPVVTTEQVNPCVL